MDDGAISSPDDIHMKGCSQHPNSVVHNNVPLSTRFTSEGQHCYGDDVFTVGGSINVRVSCIEGLQKFWCQSTENLDSLRLLMQDLQNHYKAPHPQAIVDSVCVARNPENSMWHRARIIASDHSPVVDVHFIDYGETQTVPLQDVRPIDPAFLQLGAQAFQCCLTSLNNSTNPKIVPSTDATVAEFQKFVDSAATSNTGLKCVVKAITTDETGQLLNIVDIKTQSDSVCKLLAQKWAQIEIEMPIPPQVRSDGYNYSTYNIEVGGKEKVRVTSSESVSHFYCQLDRNAHLLHKVMENVMQLTGQPQCRDGSLGLNSICLVRYTDDQWHRGQIVEMSPSLKVHFVDYGDTLEVNKSDICPFPSKGCSAKSVPVQAVPLGLFDMPGEVPQEVNQWFADHAIDHGFTISVVTKGANGKLMVELFDGSLNVNVKIRKRILNMARHKMTDLTQQTDQRVSNRSQLTCVPDECSLTQKPLNVLTELPEQNKVQTSEAVCVRDEPTMGPQSVTDVSPSEIHHGKTLDQGEDETKIAQHSLLCGPKGNTNICPYKKPNISQNKTEEVYASCIVGPDYFWCQYTDTEDLNTLSTLVQEAGQTKQETLFPETFGPGSPCLALFSSDNQWYRAQVIKRNDNTLHVLYIDYGNESDVDITNVKSLPENLLDKAPQAFLCTLNGFDESSGVWDDQAYEDFYNLLVDKPLRVTVLDIGDHSDVAVPQYAVEVECENLLVNNALQKYRKSVSKENFTTVRHQTEHSLQDDQTVSNITHLNVSGGNANASTYKKSKLSKNQTESAYASCIVDPGFFWCQYANTEELKTLSLLTQEAGQTKQETLFPETFGPGSPCLSLFSSDNQWYRAQVTKRTDNTLHVLYVDYGNESDVDITNVKSLPENLLDKAPQAFLCMLNGFDESSGVWDDRVYEDFYNLLVDKPLRVTVLDMVDRSDVAVPQYAVEVECEGSIVNTLMDKYWSGQNEDPALAGCLQSVDQDETRSVDQSAGV
ncbi:tudor domain-containing protein 6-like [Echeneis naucrates]|uniref:tudor domain-containing protein 6-like n=1 Tax=Echeneis naucrates TaxID=173247 RepID=UPI0011144F19|nr:tudor domain-containing protein 6-like [Echeneis naucrates]